MREWKADRAGEKRLHHSLLGAMGLVEATFQCRDLGFHAGECSGNGLSFGEGRDEQLNFGQMSGSNSG